MSRREELLRRLTEFPCGAAVKLDDDLDAALQGRPGVLFVLRGNGLELAPIVHRIHVADRLVAVHLDLVDGLSTDTAGVRWLVRCGVDAIISSHAQAVRSARAEGVTAIQRVLCSTRAALDLGLAAVSRAQPDIVELLPGVILPEVADLVLPRLTVPLLAGGFIRDSEDVRSVLAAGALAVTTSERALWR
jgi:glycerol uptake operon antiterminator